MMNAPAMSRGRELQRARIPVENKLLFKWPAIDDDDDDENNSQTKSAGRQQDENSPPLGKHQYRREQNNNTTCNSSKPQEVKRLKQQQFKMTARRAGQSVTLDGQLKCHKRRHPMMTMLLSLLISVSLLLAGDVHGLLDSPVRVHQQRRQLVVVENSQTIERPVNLTAGAEPLTNDNVRYDRVRRTSRQPVGQVSPGRQQRPADVECPANRLLQGLLPPEYLASPASSQRRGQTSKAYCDCTGDLYGWHLTCFASAASPSSVARPGLQPQQQDSLPNQLHPAFRGPQLQRQQQAASNLRRLQRRSAAARWMGESSSDDEPVSSTSGSLEVAADPSAVTSAHEGFGEDNLVALPASSATATTTTTTPRSASVAKSNKLRASRQNISAPRIADDDREASDFISLPSSNSFTMMSQQLNSNQQHNSMFQTVPVLFSVKYTKNNMIEIDCDQAAPQYKPAMFQGFNVNEINSFTFNNCQLPNIPFSVLLHRAKSTTTNSPTNGQPSSAADQAKLQAQQLKPTGSRPLRTSGLNGNNLSRRRRKADSAADDELANYESFSNVDTFNYAPNSNELDSLRGPESQVAPLAEGASLLARDSNDEDHSPGDMESIPASPSANKLQNEPKIKSLTINLNTIVDQRTLISLLTGLDLLEELQLNYMQLNVTSFEPDLDSDPSNQLAATSTTNLVGSSATVESEITANLAQPKLMMSSPVSPTTSTTTTSTAAPVVSSSSSRPIPAVNLATTRSNLAAVTTTPASVTVPSTTTTTSTTQKPVTTTTTTTRLRNNVNLLKPLHQSSLSTKPSSISIGAPRGLMVAQATGIPPTQLMQSQQQTTTSAPTQTLSSLQASSTTSTVPAISLTQVNSARQQQTTTSASTSVVTSTSQRQSPASDQTTTAVFNNRPIGGGGGGISVSSNQANAVTFTSSAAQPPATRSSLISSSQIGHNQIHHSPTAWFQSQPTTPGALTVNPPAAGSRLYQQPAESMQADQSTTNQNNLNAPLNTPQFNLPANQNSGFGIRTTNPSPIPTLNLQRQQTNTQQQQQRNTAQFQTTTPSLMLLNQLNNQLSSMQSTPASLTTSSLNQNRRQTTVGGSTETATSQQFVAAGNRLPFKRSPVAATGQRTPTMTTFNQNNDFANDFNLNSDQSIGNMRFKRAALEELELSFGELLPSLKSLKLESFIDLSHLSGSTKDAKPSKPSATNIRLQPRSRFKRQFKPSDVPEKDDSHSTADELDGLSSNSDDDSLIAEESSVHHNSVMIASASDRSPSTSSRLEPVDGNSDWTLPANDTAAASGELTAETDQNSPQSNTKLKHFSLLLAKLFSKLSKLKILQLSSNDIPFWPDNVLYDSRMSLKRLYLISNNIKTLSKGSFANLTELEILDLSSNQLRSLPAGIFSDLEGLKNFRACRNLFRKFPSKLFVQGKSNSSTALARPANKLENVDFSKNRYLAHVALDIFASPSSRSSTPVTSLNLSDCVFDDQFLTQNQATTKSAPELFFSTLIELTQVSLRNNKLRNLLTISNLFAKNSRLQKLDISHNQLMQVSANLFNANASALSELHLQHNQLTQIPEQFLFNLKKLRKLSLAHNRLTQLSPKMFLTNQLIEQLDLSHNQLLTLNTHQSSLIPFGNGANLKHLDLSNNNLTNFNEDIFNIAWSFYTNLQHLDLSQNQFSSQISMPIFYTIADELSLNLGFNSIQSISVEALMQHEQILDRYSTFEDGNVNSDLGASNSAAHKQAGKVPIVSIKLTGNPITCDCMIEPLINYSRRVATATNPSLMASIFSGKPDGKLESPVGAATPNSNSRYSMTISNPDANNGRDQTSDPSAARQPQLFYQFKFNDVYCSRPQNLQRKLLSHISISDLLCPIKDRKLCPNKCQCFYQSAFKRAIVECNNRNLLQVPEQLTDLANFVSFQVESSLDEENTSNRTLIGGVDKVVIRLENNKLKSIEELSKLFTVTDIQMPAGNEKNRFARESKPKSSSRSLEATSHSTSAHSAALVLDDSEIDSVEPLLSRFSSQPPLSTSSFESQQSSQSKKVISPVAIGRNMHQQQQSRQQRRRRRQINSDSSADDLSMMGMSTEPDLNSATISTTTASEGLSNDQHISTAVLETAEEFRIKRYPLTCELYLDHNLIDSIPDSFLEVLDSIRTSAMQSSLIPPQAALPTFMLEPPIHAKLNADHLSDPMRASASSTTISSVINHPDDSLSSSDHHSGEQHFNLFGRQAAPLNPERKAALIETINQNVKLNRLQQESNKLKHSVSPSLVVLSLRHNNLSNISAKMLQRLSKLIKSSNTKLYLGHNPFNCSDNFQATVPAELDGNSLDGSQSIRKDANQPEMVPASAMGDKMMVASDASSGAYLESSADDNNEAGDLSSSASSGQQSSATAAQASPPQPASDNQPILQPQDCPIGQLKTWVTKHHSSIGDLDELYCVHMPQDLADKLKLSAGKNSSTLAGEKSTSKLPSTASSSSSSKYHDHEHYWASSLVADPSLATGLNQSSHLEKNGFHWNSELLISSSKLIDVNTYDLCPYSNIQLLESQQASGLLSPVHQQILLSISIILILISLCLLLMLVYFGDTQTILAFIYIHLNPLYSCLKLNESHLDGDKLYDAFVSYSSADRDIVMELIEKLEQQSGPDGNNNKPPNYGGITNDPSARSATTGKGNIMDRSHDTLVTDADLSTLSRRTLSSSFQDLNTMSRSSSRITISGNDGNDPNKSSSKLNISGGGHSDEKSVTPYRLCIHERDWLPGHLISWNIVNSVQNSRRTILILSKDFIKSVWFQVEFHTAYYQMLEDKIDRLIVIVRGDLPPKSELDKNLAFLLTTKTYLTWGEKWFWERLHYALPHRASPPPVVKQPQQQPIKHYHQASSKKATTGGSDLSLALAANQQQQKPLVMSSIGKDCSNLLLPVHHNQQQQPMIGSSSSSGSANSVARSTSSSSFLSGSSTGNLLSPTTMTTANDLLSTTTGQQQTTKVLIGSSSNKDLIDSGRVTGSSAQSIGSSTANQPAGSSAAEVTSILVDQGPNSKLRAKKQEKLQQFVDKKISNHFNLSEL